MSLEKNLEEVKDKLAKDQSLLVSAFRLESFYKKYKIFIFAFIAIIILFGIYKGVTLFLDSRKELRSNEIIAKLHKGDLSDEEKNELSNELSKINPSLNDFYIYTSLQELNVLQIKEQENLDKLKQLIESKNDLIAALALYQYASVTEDINLLENFNPKWTNPTLKDRARYQAAYLHLKNGNIQKAHQILDSITPSDYNQFVYAQAKRLRHYGVNVKSSNDTKSKDSAKSDIEK